MATLILEAIEEFGVRGNQLPFSGVLYTDEIPSSRSSNDPVPVRPVPG
jgi:hypothetical protein